ncbi:MAG: hypothetical protein IPQ07_09280 [Myxococcales bacterium]|nr:hypothetical protein [Myxococcales bacterium]
MRSLLVLVALAGSTSCTDDEPACLDCFGYLQLNWSFRSSTNAVLPCPTDFPRVRVTMPEAPAAERVRIYDCAAMQARETFDGGMYDLTVAVVDDAGTVHAEEHRPIEILILGQTRRVAIEFVEP